MSTTKDLKKTLVAALMSMVMVGLAAQSALAQLSVPPPPIQSYDGDPGRLGDPASWRTPEFLRDNGMVSIGAEFAYAAGYAGAGMNIGVVDSGFFAGHMREHGSLATNYAIGDRYFSVVGAGRRHRPDARVLRPGVQRQPRHARQRHRRREPRRRRRDAAHRAQSPTCTASRSTADVYLGNTHKTDGVLYGLLPADRDRRADAGQRLHRERLPGRERRGAPGTASRSGSSPAAGAASPTPRTTTPTTRRPAHRRASG